MKTFVTKRKQSAPAIGKARPYQHHSTGPVQRTQQEEIRRILRSNGAQAKLNISQPSDKYEQIVHIHNVTQADSHAKKVYAGTVKPRKPSRFPPILGVTQLPFPVNPKGGRFVYPELKFKVVRTPKIPGPMAPPSRRQLPKPVRYTAYILPTTSRDATHPSIAIPAGKHKANVMMVNLGTAAMPKRVQLDRVFIITKAIAKLVKKGEQEHLNDMQRAYGISLARAAHAVNTLAMRRTPFVARSASLARGAARIALGRRLPRKLGTTTKGWKAAVQALCQQTQKRDDLLYHSMRKSCIDNVYNREGKRYAACFFTRSRHTRIGGISSSKIIGYNFADFDLYYRVIKNKHYK